MAESPPNKKARIDTFEKFHAFKEKDAFCEVYKNMLFNRRVALVSDKITYCDANAEYGKPFSKATCHATPVVEELYPFGSIFYKGVKILNNVADQEGYIPEDEETRTLLHPLLEYILDEKCQDCLRSLSTTAENETQLIITLGAHFFSKLAVAKEFKINKYASRKGCLCSCGNCSEKAISAQFDDTSIGHKKVWHGSVDIMLESSDISVHCSPAEENRRTSVEAKFCDLGSLAVRDQILAQTITFSFLQQQRHPAFKHFLFPSILASDKAVQFFFYDSKNDILLESREFKYFDEDRLKLSYQTVIATWLVLNYKYLSSGPTEHILKAPKSDFCKLAGDALDIYRSDLRYRNVAETSEEEKLPRLVWWEIDEGMYNRCPFEWPKTFPPVEKQ